MADDEPTPAQKDRIGAHETPEEMTFTKPGEPYPEVMIELSDGTTVPESVFGRPPSDMPITERDAWYANREAELLKK